MNPNKRTFNKLLYTIPLKQENPEREGEQSFILVDYQCRQIKSVRFREREREKGWDFATDTLLTVF